MKVLGVSAFYHDSAAAIVQNGAVIAAAQEERFTRKKHDDNFPSNAVSYCLKAAGITVDELDAVVFYDKPLLKFERLLETYLAFSPHGLRSFMLAMPVWIKQKLFLKKLIRDELGKLQSYNKKKLKLLFAEHHLSHAASAYFPSGFSDSAVLVMDGVGEWATASIYEGKGHSLRVLRELHFPNSLGLFYSAFTYYLGFKVNSGEYKLMGLAPYGNKYGKNYKLYLEKIKSELLVIHDDGSLQLNLKFFDYVTGLTMTKDKKWETLFGIKRRKPEAKLEQEHCDLALAVQTVTEEIVIKMAAEAKKLTRSENICLAGGVALNCVANGKLQDSNLFKNIFIQPAAGDAGGALGAAMAANYIYFKDKIAEKITAVSFNGSLLGPEFTHQEILNDLKPFNAVYTCYSEFNELTKNVAELIDKGMVVGWFQGRMEFGPRALGNRSILGDARNADMQKKINLSIKYREGFRPFAPSVLIEDAAEFFDMKSDSPYMLMVRPIHKSVRCNTPVNYESLGMDDKLSTVKSSIPAVTHVDFSARVQTVTSEFNPRFYDLLTAFKNISGSGLLVNTSMNVRGEPMVCSPADAYKCLMRTKMDYLIIGNFVFERNLQPKYDEKLDWRQQFKPD